jgi:hypothetical protein
LTTTPSTGGLAVGELVVGVVLGLDVAPGLVGETEMLPVGVGVTDSLSFLSKAFARTTTPATSTAIRTTALSVEVAKEM